MPIPTAGAIRRCRTCRDELVAQRVGRDGPQSSARGAGYSWGLAEEAGRATRWLAAAGLPGPMCLARLLAEVDGADFKDFTPAVSAGRCTADSGALCPILTGVALCDGALDYSPMPGLMLSNLSAPLLLLPFVAQIFGTPDVWHSEFWGSDF